MYCTNCGAQIPPGAANCPNCGAIAPQQTRFHPAPATATMTQPVTINNYLIPSILVTLCCCLPGGVVAIVYAAQVNSKLAAGDVAGAQAAANNAKMWCWISFAVGILGALIGVVINIGTLSHNLR